MWDEIYELTYCGVEENARARIEVHDSQPPKMHWRIAGNTKLEYGEPRSHLIPIALMTLAGHRIEGCSLSDITPESSLINTVRSGGPGTSLSPSRRYEWDEVWVLHLCGRRAPIRLRFNRSRETGLIERISRVTLIDITPGVRRRPPVQSPVVYAYPDLEDDDIVSDAQSADNDNENAITSDSQSAVTENSGAEEIEDPESPQRPDDSMFEDVFD